ncbi:MAG: hypothetical protein BV457_03465 [Thermoplasmata archaeon M9B1D]|nr:MAG: hypothetical protein BV457_03465 [Thermoplasmata archaeon M9B1D]PNX51247.1 MAG: hypothetical protein BV456_03880 [Thermoplasmata archaeon M8B2D]
MNIENIKPSKNDFVMIKKKTISILAILIILGLITGFILSTFFYNEANHKIDEYNDNMNKWFQMWNNSLSNNSKFNNSSPFISNQSTNYSFYNPYLKHLYPSDVILLTIGVLAICITIYLKIGIISAYLYIFFKSKSPYIIGLILVFIPLLIISLFLLNMLRALYYSSALEFSILASSLGFGVEGLAAIICIVTIIEIIGLSILFYLTNE